MEGKDKDIYEQGDQIYFLHRLVDGAYVIPRIESVEFDRYLSEGFAIVKGDLSYIRRLSDMARSENELRPRLIVEIDQQTAAISEQMRLLKEYRRTERIILNAIAEIEEQAVLCDPAERRRAEKEGQES